MTPYENTRRYEENEYADTHHSMIHAIEKDSGANDEDE